VVKAAINTNMSITAHRRHRGRDRGPDPHALPQLAHLAEGPQRTEIFALIEGQGLKYQAVEVQRCIAAGLTESPVMPHSETLALAHGWTRSAPRSG
jgi:hypothetical protein